MSYSLDIHPKDKRKFLSEKSRLLVKSHYGDIFVSPIEGKEVYLCVTKSAFRLPDGISVERFMRQYRLTWGE